MTRRTLELVVEGGGTTRVNSLRPEIDGEAFRTARSENLSGSTGTLAEEFKTQCNRPRLSTSSDRQDREMELEDTPGGRRGRTERVVAHTTSKEPVVRSRTRTQGLALTLSTFVATVLMREFGYKAEPDHFETDKATNTPRDADSIRTGGRGPHESRKATELLLVR
jgi:hypothetical protein